MNEIERLVVRVVSRLNDLQVVAELSGSMASPKFSVSSNLDKVIAQRLQAVVGEEVARAEKMVRAKVDSLVADKVEPVKRRVLMEQMGPRVAAELGLTDEEDAPPRETKAPRKRKGWA